MFYKLKRTFVMLVIVAIFSIGWGAPANSAVALSYKDIPGIASYFFYTHVVHREFTEELYVRTVKNFIKLLDPTKIFLMAADAEQFEGEAQKNSAALLSQFKSADMSFFIKIHSIFKTRLEERYKTIESMITENFKILPAKETENMDSPEVKFSKNTEEIEMRLKKILSLQFESMKSAKKTMKETAAKLTARYKEVHKHYNEFDETKIADVILKSFSMALDPHSLYFSPEEIDSFNISFKLSLEGIGATLRSDDGYTIVESLVPGSPAQNTGKIKAGDKIVAVGQENGDMIDVIGLEINKVVQKIRGPKGTKVRLSMVREIKDKPSEQFLVTIVRDKIKLVDQATKKEVKVVNGKKYGVIMVPSFMRDMEGVRKNVAGAATCSGDVKDALQYFHDTGEIEGVILDLRNNTGGSLGEAVKMAGLFIKRGVVVMVKDSAGNVQELADEDPTSHFTGPLVVLVNKLSASASEIVAGALKDYGRAVIAGDSMTFGKGSVQTMLPNLPGNIGAIKVTNALYFTAGGASTQKKGVPVDILIPSLSEDFKHGEATADYALDWQIISSAIPKNAPDPSIEVRDNSLDLILPTLIADSKKRVEANPKFKEIAEKAKKKNIDEDDEMKVEDTKEAELKKKDDVVLDEAINILKEIKEIKK